jgi:hypothetical protein
MNQEQAERWAYRIILAGLAVFALLDGKYDWTGSRKLEQKHCEDLLDKVYVEQRDKEYEKPIPEEALPPKLRGQGVQLFKNSVVCSAAAVYNAEKCKTFYAELVCGEGLNDTSTDCATSVRKIIDAVYAGDTK